MQPSDLRARPRDVVEAVMQKPLKWEEVDASNRERVTEIAQSAQLILDSWVWQNETTRLIDTWVRTVAVDATSYGQVEDARMCIVALQLLQERFQMLANLGSRNTDRLNEIVRFDGV